LAAAISDAEEEIEKYKERISVANHIIEAGKRIQAEAEEAETNCRKRMKTAASIFATICWK